MEVTRKLRRETKLNLSQTKQKSNLDINPLKYWLISRNMTIADNNNVHLSFSFYSTCACPWLSIPFIVSERTIKLSL